nr:4'-phosphopantetheinyl transferase superfamily protein [Pseudomaricurvus sp. HS19]
MQAAADAGHWAGLLGASEQLRLARYQGRRRQQFLLGRALLRTAFSQVVDNGRSPETWQITEQEDLPPAIADSGDWYFSLSHSRDLIAVVLSDSGPCGVDIEFCKPRQDFAALAEGWFHAQEITELQTRVAHDQLQMFYRLWTLKEAWLKTRRQSLFSGGMAAVTFEQSAMGCANHSWLRTEIGDDYSVAVITASPASVTTCCGLPPQAAATPPLSWQRFAVNN